MRRAGNTKDSATKSQLLLTHRRRVKRVGSNTTARETDLSESRLSTPSTLKPFEGNNKQPRSSKTSKNRNRFRVSSTTLQSSPSKRTRKNKATKNKTSERSKRSSFLIFWLRNTKIKKFRPTNRGSVWTWQAMTRLCPYLWSFFSKCMDSSQTLARPSSSTSGCKSGDRAGLIQVNTSV